MYGNDTYPASRRIYSRPYPCYFQHLYDKPIDKEMAEFREALHSIGEDLLGKPFDWNLDVDFRASQWFSPPFWNENKVTELTSARNKMKASLPMEAQIALDAIIGHIAQAKVLEPVPGKHNSFQRQTPYDTALLAKNFKVLWQHDIMLDARLTQAEEMFFYSDRLANDDFHYRAPANLAASLDWVAQPENAKRVALMFLYSRLAQHYGEVDPRSFAFAQKVAAELDGGGRAAVIEKLRSLPASYYAETAGAKKPLHVSFFEAAYMRVAPFIAPLKNIFIRETGADYADGRDNNRGGLVNAAALAASAQTMADDYLRLADGSWAKAQRELVLANVVHKAPAVPVPAPLAP